MLANRVATSSQPELAVRAKTHKLQGLVVGFAIDEHQIGSDVAVAAIVPGAAQWVIAKARRQGRILAKHLDDLTQQVIEPARGPTLLLTLVVAFEAARALNRPHRGT